MDNGSDQHIVNDRTLLTDLWEVEPNGVYTGKSTSEYHQVGIAAIPFQRPSGEQGVLRVLNARYILDFYTTCISIRLLNEGGVFWNNEENQLYWKDTKEVLAQLEQRYHQNVLFFREPEASDEPEATDEAESQPDAESAFPVHSREAEVVRTKPADLWHRRIGHCGPVALEHLAEQSIGVKLKGIPTCKCEFCALAKLRKTISRQTPTKAAAPGGRVHMDMFYFPVAFNGHLYALIAIDEATGRTFVWTDKEKTFVRRAVRELKAYLWTQYGIKLRIVRSDQETSLQQKVFGSWLDKEGVKYKKSAP